MTPLKQGDKPEVMLKAVVEKAVKNGWEPFSQEWIDWVFENDAYKELLFDFEFAKEYFKGEFETCRYGCQIYGQGEGCHHDLRNRMEGWKYHLQQAVISENPLLYYYQHL